MNDSASSTEITMNDWEQRKAFVGFTDEDVELLKKLRPVAAKFADEVMEDLYRRFMQFEEAKLFFPDDATLNRVKGLQKKYFLELTGGEYGEPYLANRLNIGRVHLRIGLSPRWYMGAYSIYMQLVSPRVMTAFGKDVKKAQQMLMALQKLIWLDQELAIHAYITAGERVISQQLAEEILEIATPIIQVWEGVIAAPLIGTLDTRRAQQLMEQLLKGIVETNSSVALLDITGTPAIDTRTAQHLIETIAAARMLGAQVVLTGVRPAIAQTLVHLGIDLSNIVTRSSLAAGLSYALDKLNLQVTSTRRIS